VLPPRSETELLAVGKSLPNAEMSFEYEFQFLPGEPGAEHRPDRPYRLPYSLASTIRVSQAFPEMATHTDPSSQHAIDFVMPVGTNVFAARAGVVIDVAGDFFENGTSVAVDGPRANLVRVLHDDGTMSIYGHLNWNSIRVVPGQRVARGEYLADSGNTGFSTGPAGHDRRCRHHRRADGRQGRRAAHRARRQDPDLPRATRRAGLCARADRQRDPCRWLRPERRDGAGVLRVLDQHHGPGGLGLRLDRGRGRLG
jgi:hypothetical protein